MNLEKLCAECQDITREAGEYIAGQSLVFSERDVVEKEEHSYVTYVDKQAEKILAEGLASILPGADFLAEEGTLIESGNRYKWIVDPLDGTTNFLHGIPAYCVSVGLTDYDEVILGVLYDIPHKTIYYAWKDSPSFRNHEVIQVSKRPDIKSSLIGTGFPYQGIEEQARQFELLKYLMKHCRGFRRIGSAALDLAYLAAGHFEGFFEYSLNPWDVAAGIIIVQQAGGTVTDFRGGRNYLYGGEIMASNGLISGEFQSLIDKYLNKR